MRKNTIKIIILILLIFMFICFVVPILMIGGLFPPPPSRDMVYRMYKRDKQMFDDVAEYLQCLDYESVYIYDTKEKGTMFVDDEGDVIITNEHIISCIDLLQHRKMYSVSVIEKNNNIIYFQIWSNLDAGRGVTYSIDGKEPVLQFLTKLEKLQEDNWYYYEEDYNKWRLQ